MPRGSPHGRRGEDRTRAFSVSRLQRLAAQPTPNQSMMQHLAFAGPFWRSAIGGRRTFSRPSIGVCRTFFLEWMGVDGLLKPIAGSAFLPYKAYVSSKLICFKQRGERAIARLLFSFLSGSDTDCRSSPDDRGQLKRRNGGCPANGEAKVGRVRRTIAGRSPPMAVGAMGQACRARPTIRLGKAASSMLGGTARRGPAAATPGLTTLAGTRSS